MKNVTKPEWNLLQRWFHCLIFLMLLSVSSMSQNVAINTTLNPANLSAGLDIDFPAQGLLVPRVALIGLTSVAPLAAHVAGMFLYNTATTGDVTPGLYFNDGTKWIQNTPQGSAPGVMIYWNGTGWAMISGGIAGQFLSIGVGGNPQWSGTGSGYATLSTNVPINITATTASGGGNITNDGGSPVTERGVCWDTAPNPTIALTTKTLDGSGTGTFSSNISGLTTLTTYYIRAYATNSVGTAYGNQVTITTN